MDPGGRTLDRTEDKSFLLRRMHELLLQKQAHQSNYMQRKRMRDNLVEFAARKLDQEGFEELIWILKDGSVDLLPFPNTCVQGYEQLAALQAAPSPKRTAQDPDIGRLKKSVEGLKKSVTDIEKRLNVVEGHEYKPNFVPDPTSFLPKTEFGIAQPPINRDFDLPLVSCSEVERVNNNLRIDVEYYNTVVRSFREVFQLHIHEGWKAVFNGLFTKGVMMGYHYNVHSSEPTTSNDGTIRLPVHHMKIFTSVLNDAFDETEENIISKLREHISYVRRCFRDYRYTAKKRRNQDSMRSDVDSMFGAIIGEEVERKVYS